MGTGTAGSASGLGLPGAFAERRPTSVTTGASRGTTTKRTSGCSASGTTGARLSRSRLPRGGRSRRRRTIRSSRCRCDVGSAVGVQLVGHQPRDGRLPGGHADQPTIGADLAARAGPVDLLVARRPDVLDVVRVVRRPHRWHPGQMSRPLDRFQPRLRALARASPERPAVASHQWWQVEIPGPPASHQTVQVGSQLTGTPRSSSASRPRRPRQPRRWRSGCSRG